MPQQQTLHPLLQGIMALAQHTSAVEFYKQQLNMQLQAQDDPAYRYAGTRTNAAGTQQDEMTNSSYPTDQSLYKEGPQGQPRTGPTYTGQPGGWWPMPRGR